jgi:hypothetical protein
LADPLKKRSDAEPPFDIPFDLPQAPAAGAGLHAPRKSPAAGAPAHEPRAGGIAARALAAAAAPAPAAAAGPGSACSTTSATMQVMLSGPPARSANPTSRSTASCGSPAPARLAPMVSSVTTDDSPSLHSRYRSPTSASRTDRCGTTRLRPSRAWVSTDRCGWWAASSAVICPASTRVWT